MLFYIAWRVIASQCSRGDPVIHHEPSKSLEFNPASALKLLMDHVDRSPQAARIPRYAD